MKYEKIINYFGKPTKTINDKPVWEFKNNKQITLEDIEAVIKDDEYNRLYAYFPIFDHTNHKNLWNWIAIHPTKNQQDWFKIYYKKHNKIEENSFACETAFNTIRNVIYYKTYSLYSITSDTLISRCDFCPLKTDNYTPINCLNGLYNEYTLAKMDKKKKEIIYIAKIIRDLPVTQEIPRLLVI